jgi:hypothetical protein
VLKVFKVNWVHKVLLVHKVCKAQQEPQVHKAFKVL